MIENPTDVAARTPRGVRARTARAVPSQETTVGRRLSVNVALDVADAIDKLAKRHRTTITDVIRRAVSTYKFIDDEASAGGKILVERNGTIREVKFL